MGIHDEILNKTYQQVLKLLNPDCREAHRLEKEGVYKPPTADEKRALSFSGGGILEKVQMGTFPLKNFTGLTYLPAIYIANGVVSDADAVSARIAELGASTLQTVYEVMPLTLRLVIHQEVEPKYEDSNPIRIAKIRKQLDYFLDFQSFGGITERRFGYRIPSKVRHAVITTSESLKGIAAPWEIMDFNFQVIFERQYSRD